MKDVNQNFVKFGGVIPVMCLLSLQWGALCAGICCCCRGLDCGGIDWGWPSTVCTTGSALEGGLSPAKGSAGDCEGIGMC